MQLNIKRVAREWKERERREVERQRDRERQRQNSQEKFTGKDKCQGLFLNKVAGHRCFSVNFMNF